MATANIKGEGSKGDPEQAVRKAELKATKEMLQATLDCSLYVIQAFQAIRDKNGKITDFIWVMNNQPAIEQNGNVIGKSLLEQNPGVVPSGLFEKFVQVTETGIPVDQEVFYYYEQFNGWFRQTLVKMGDGFVMNTEDITERKKQQEELLRLKDEIAKKATDKYQALFNSIDEGLSVVELVYDESGGPVDMRWLETNPAFEKITGLKNVAGRYFSEFFRTDPNWLHAMDSVAKTGEPLRYEKYQEGLQQWFRTHTSRIGGPGSHLVVNVFEDITERKRREEHMAFMANIHLNFAPLLTVQEVMDQAGKLLVAHLHLSRCHFSIVDEETDCLEVVYEYRRNPDLPSIMGTHHILDHITEEGRKYFKEGKLAVVDSAKNSWLRKTPAELLEQFGFGSLLDVPHLEAGRWKFLLTLGRLEPGGWRKDEVEMLEELSSKIFLRIERALAEEALRKSEAKFRRLSESGLVAVAFFDPGGPITDANDAFLEMLGLTREDLRTEKMRWDVYTPKEWIPRTLEAFEELKTSGFIAPYEKEFYHSSGQRRWGIFTGATLNDGTTGVSLVVDITERKKAEEALSRSEGRFRTLADAVPQVIWTNDAAGKAIYFNRRWYEFSGLSYQESQGPGWQAIVHPADAEQARQKWLDALQAGTAFETEYRLRRDDGSYCWFIGRNVPVQDENGKIAGWFGSATDIENLKKTERALSLSEARLRITMESATDYGIITMDNNRKVEKWSQGAIELFQFTEEEMRGCSADIIFTEEDRKNNVPQKEMETARDTGRAADERWHMQKDGSRFFASGVMRPIQGEELTGYVKVLRDTTQERLFTEELHRLVNERTYELQRTNENLQQFATIAAHDLQEPLRKLRLFSSVLKRYSGQLPEEGMQLLTKINLTSRRMSQLIQEVLQYSRLDNVTAEFEPTDLDEVLKRLLNDLDLKWKESQAKLFYPQSLPAIDAVPAQMHQLFYNLLTNALKFSMPGTSPQISISCEPAPPVEIETFSFLQQDRNYIKITVSDKGIGFEQKYAEQIFQIFERLHSVEEYEGTGVGLALCRKIVQNHGGYIFARSAEGDGASFYIILPEKQVS